MDTSRTPTPRRTGRRTRPVLGAVSALSLLTLAACGTQSGAGGGPDGTVKPDIQVAGTDWTVDSVTVDGAKVAAPEGATVRFDEKGRAEGRTGCNQFGADVSVEGDTVTVGPALTTEIGCSKELEKFEKSLHRTFKGELKAKMTDNTLTLTTAKGDKVSLSEAKPVPAAPLTGTQWRVESLRDGDSVTTPDKEVQGKARLVFDKDGSVGGHLGCNNVSGKAEVSGSTLTFSKIATTRKLCTPEVMETERALLKVLEGKATYEVRERTLTLTGADGKGLEAVSVMVTQSGAQ